MKFPKQKLLLIITFAALATAVLLFFLLEQGYRPQIPLSEQTKTIFLSDGEILNLEAGLVTKEIRGQKYRMYAYNGQIPGPLLRVKQGSTVFINFTNNIDMDTTIHWHGLRHKNANDGVPGITQKPVGAGESFLYELQFPDTGIYWYHPHVREDVQQERGLYGNIIVEPSDQADRPTYAEIPLILDDILVEGGEFLPLAKNATNFALMGRFGNVLLVNGVTDYQLKVKQGDVVRFYLTNVANVRPFNISIEGALIKVIGSDMGLYEREFFSNSIIIAPAERYIFETQFKKPGVFRILHKTPNKTYVLGQIIVDETQETTTGGKLDTLLENKDVRSDIRSFEPFFNKTPDFEMVLTIDMKGMMMDHMENEGPIEWEDSMFPMNQAHTNRMMEWIIEDKKSGRKNMDIMYTARVGDVKKVRIVNEIDSVHPMQHPIHLHGQRFLVLERNGQIEDNLVWKDTVLVPKGEYVDLLVDFTNPGDWMIHCHIAEHLESGMMTMFKVEE